MDEQRVENRLADPVRLGNRQWRAPAWLISVAVHLLILLVTALYLGGAHSPQGRRGPAPDSEHSAAIVLVARAAGAPQYFTESESEAVGSQNAAGPNPADSALAGGFPLPPLGPPPLAAEIALPQISLPASAGNPGIPSPQIQGGPRGPVLPKGIDDQAILEADAAIIREQLPTGPTARLALFGAQAEGRSFVFVIDRSQSMGGDGLGAIQAAAAELSKQLGTLTEEQTVQVLAYNQANSFLSGRELIPASADNKQRLADFVAEIAAFGQTEHVRALLAALRLEPEVIFLLTDGGDPHPSAFDLQTIREAAAGRTAIHTLHFGRGEAGPAAAFLSRIAAENRGTYTYIDLSRR